MDRRSLSAFPWHPMIFAGFFVLSVYQTNAGHHPLTVVWAPLVVSILIVLVGLGLSSLLARSPRVGALVCSLVLTSLLLFLSLEPFLPARGRLPAFLLFFVGQVFVVWRIGTARRTSLRLTRMLNTVAWCCLASVSLFIVLPMIRTYSVSRNMCFPEVEPRLKATSPESPDILYVVLDGYARNDVLQELYGYDNRPFTDALQARGFYVADRARANYCQTGLSMSSALNVDYFAMPPRWEGSDNRKILGTCIRESRLPGWLQEAGYGLQICESGYYLTDSLDGAERIRTCTTDWNEFQFEVLRKATLWFPLRVRRKILVPISERTLMDQHRVRVGNALEFLARGAPGAGAPTFTFIHILAPHPPFLFADPKLRTTVGLPYSVKDGSHLLASLFGGKEEYRRLYVSQLQWLNQQVLAALEQRLAVSSRRPQMILVQSDHGAGSELNWNDIQASNGKERLGILNAVYFSDADYSALKPDLTLINTARVVLNKTVMEEPLPLVEEQSFLSSWPAPYRFYPWP